MYRGKYCGKSKLREKVDEFGEESQPQKGSLRSNRVNWTKKPRVKSAYGATRDNQRELNSVTPIRSQRPEKIVKKMNQQTVKNSRNVSRQRL